MFYSSFLQMVKISEILKVLLRKTFFECRVVERDICFPLVFFFMLGFLASFPYRSDLDGFY